MKTSVIISGQLNSVNTLKKVISDFEDIETLPFNNYKLIFATKNEAQKSLSEAWKYMKQNDYITSSMEQVYRKNGRVYMITYDAARAIIN